MLLKVDASKLEWVVKVWMAQDKVGMKELSEGLYDIHTDNQTKFNLPNRTIAKNFVYQMIFADAFGEQGFNGPAYSYAHKADFQEASTSIKFWEDVVEKFFSKYQGIYNHSVDLIRRATGTGKIVLPSGRFYTFAPLKHWNGQLDWPRTKILNYPIQGFAADLMMVYRLVLSNHLKKYKYENCLLINTVHDDVEMDVDTGVDKGKEILYNICSEMEDCFKRLPEEFEKRFGVRINVPMSGESKFGWSLFEKDMVKFNKETFDQDWRKINAISN